MYRVRLGSGEQAVFRSANEMAVAVSTGVVSPTAEVFHTAGRRWLPIETHPDYRAAVAVGEPSQRISGRQAAQPGPQEGEYDPSRDPTPVAVSSSPPSPASRAQRLRIALALSIALGALILGGSGGYYGARMAERWIFGLRYQPPVMTEGMGPEPAPAPSAPAPGVQVAPSSFPAPSAPQKVAPLPAAEAPAAPEDATQTTRLSATRNSSPSYFEAYADARAEMEDGFEYIGFRRLFDPSRFASPDNIRATRRMLAAASNIVGAYRGREVMLEQTYRPDELDETGSLRETFESAQGARVLLTDVDSLFGVLQSWQGRYSYSEQSVTFQDPAAARAYASLRRDIITRIQGWRDLPESSIRVTIPRLLTAVGPYLPPPPAIR